MASEEDKIHVVIHLSNHLIAEAIYQLLSSNGYDDVVVGEERAPGGSTPQVLLVGTGRRALLPRPALVLPFSQRGIGVEIMTTAAACRI